MTDLPPPSPELVLIRELVDWHLSMMPRREAERARNDLNARFALLGELTTVTIMRPASEFPAQLKARKRAARWWLSAFGPRDI